MWKDKYTKYFMFYSFVDSIPPHALHWHCAEVPSFNNNIDKRSFWKILEIFLGGQHTDKTHKQKYLTPPGLHLLTI